MATSHPAQDSNTAPAEKMPSAVMILAGVSRRPDLEVQTGRHRFDLPLGDGNYILTRLLGCLEEGCPQISQYRVILGHDTEMPRCAASVSSRVSFKRDPREFRGTGGSMADSAADIASDGMLLVVQAFQVLLSTPGEIVKQMLEASERERADVVISTEPDQSPTGLMLVRASVLKDLPTVGYVDFKEQVLPALAKQGRVAAIRCATTTAVPVRTYRNYLKAVRLTTLGVPAGSDEGTDPLLELDPSRPGTFCLIEEGATVAEGAKVIDSVVLRGAVVESGATVLRSVLGEGAVARSGNGYVERLMSGEQRPRPALNPNKDIIRRKPAAGGGADSA